MQNIEIELPSGVTSAQIEQAIDAALTVNGLELALRGTLKKFPGCIHWHARNPGQAGTLEFTFWPQQRRVWMTIQSGRTAPWIAKKLLEVQAVLHRQLEAGL